MQQPRIVIWRAVSTEEQAERESLAHQDRLNREHAARWNGIIVGDLEVPGLSRNYILWDDACREIDAFARLDDMIRRKSFDILMCMDITRLGRTAALVATIAALCEKAGIRIYETSAPPNTIDGPTTFDTRLLMLFKAGQSEQEVRKFAERSVFGRQAQVRKGKHVSNVPLGLKRIYDEHGEAHTVIDEKWRPVIELFYDLYVNFGRTRPQIAEEFNARGIDAPDGQPWNRDSIRILYRNRWTYAGFAMWGERSKRPGKAFRVKAEWPAIISEEMARAAEKGAKDRAQKPKAAARPGRFSMMMRCAHCGEAVHTHTYATRPGHRKMGYICRFRCKGSFVRETSVIASVEQAIIYLQGAAQLEQFVGQTPDEHATYAQLLEDAKKGRTDVERERKRLTLAYIRETIDIDEYEALMAELKARHDGLAHTITELEDQLAATPTAERRRQRLEEIRDRGVAMLHHPDIHTANNWLREHLIIYVGGNIVQRIHFY